MKKIAIAITLSIFATALPAQGVRMGLTAGPQISWMKSDAAATGKEDSQFGFNFGLSTDFFFSERYSFSTGLMINNTGGKLKYNNSLNFKTNDETYALLAGATIKYKIQYIDIPLSFRMESNQIGYFLYYAQFGITNQFRVRATADIEGETLSGPISLSGVGCKDEINLFNMAYNIGAGMNYYFSKNTALTFGILYTNGFIDATSNSGTTDNVSLRSVTLKIGMLF